MRASSKISCGFCGALKKERGTSTDRALQQFLLVYRITPNPNTPMGRSPIETMFTRKVKSFFDRLFLRQAKFKKNVSLHKKYFYPGDKDLFKAFSMYFLAMPGVCGLRPCAWTHQKKAFCPICPFGGASIKYRSIVILCLSSCWGAIRPAVFAAVRIWPSMSRIWRFPLASGGRPPRRLHPSGVGFIAWRLKRP